MNMEMMKINYWSTSGWISDPELLIYKDNNSDIYVKSIISEYKEHAPKINTIEIETVNRCNNDCSFCPVSKGNDIRKMTKMSDEMFYGIIDELAAMNYDGYLSLFSNNEPLIDSRIINFIEYAKLRLPNAKHVLFTNGILLTKEKYLKLIKYLDYLIIDNYSDELELMDNIKELQEIDISQYGSCKVHVEVRKKNQILSTRGGLAPNKQIEGKYNSACILPFMQMIIRPDGKVSRCCQDAYGLMTMADVSKEGIEGAWNSRVFTYTRDLMIRDGRMSVKGCKDCDLFGLHNYFPVQWRIAYTNAFIKLVWNAKNMGKRIVVDSEISENIIYLLKVNGINVDATTADIENFSDEDCFFVFDMYDWYTLQHFKPNEAGIKYTIFEEVYIFAHKGPRINFSTQMDIMLNVKSAEMDNKLIVFGAGRNARILYNKYNFDVRCYVDNNRDKIGQEYLGRQIQSIEAIGKEDLVLVAANDYKKIKEQLLKFGINFQQIVNGNKLI